MTKKKTRSDTLAAAAPVVQGLQSRIVGHGEVAPDQLLAHPLNFRRHPGEQLEALRGSLNVLGWIKSVLVNQRTGHVLDGHARVEEALRLELGTVPVTYVDLSEEEERLALAVLDPISGLAYQDEEVLGHLLAGLSAQDAQLDSFLDRLRDDASELPEATLKEYGEDDGPPPEDEATLAGRKCPQCGHILDAE